MKPLQLAVIQTSFSDNADKNFEKINSLIQKAADGGAHLILTPELMEGHYFPREINNEHFQRAKPFENNPTLQYFQGVAEKLNVYLPISFFEKSNEKYFNSIAFITNTGKIAGVYRKTFIPSGPGYEEKHYFQSGDTGFKVWDTLYGKIGVGICWDQWFPEAARGMILKGADILLYPTCIGSEPENPNFDTKDLWQKAMVGHAVVNVTPVAAANRIGTEGNQTYYGSSFICNHRGKILFEASRNKEEILEATFHISEIREDRKDFGLIDDLIHWQSL